MVGNVRERNRGAGILVRSAKAAAAACAAAALEEERRSEMWVLVIVS